MATTKRFHRALLSGFINGVTETTLIAYDAKTIDPFFDTTPYVGAVRDANDTWYQGWTCSSSTLSFGGTGGACTAISVFNDP